MLRQFKILLLTLCGLLVLSSCQQMGAGGRHAVDSTQTALEETKEAVKEIFYYKPEEEQYKPIPYTFCYKVMQDINCYNQPLPDARGQLVGWQGRGDFEIEDTSRLPAKTALVRQPRKADTRTKFNQILEPEEKKDEKPEVVNLEPVFIPEAPKPKTDKTVTIKIENPNADTLY